MSSEEEKEKHKRIHLSLKHHHESEYTMKIKSIWIKWWSDKLVQEKKYKWIQKRKEKNKIRKK